MRKDSPGFAYGLDLEPITTLLAALQAASNEAGNNHGVVERDERERVREVASRSEEMRLKLLLLLSTLTLICAQTQLLDYGERAGDQVRDVLYFLYFSFKVRT
ncbi:unnamed protein product [Strongylus vulgaris]|uniref:Uncharacterized protein n=1 Tax=Strongylus vulgaris TaxID=40348 RepID=A0A3P7JWR7_STRVU|nr:unnamed protein product [Strongylus vulgaris]